MPKLEAKDHINVLELKATIFDTITFMKVHFFCYFSRVARFIFHFKEFPAVSGTLFCQQNFILEVEFYSISRVLSC